LIVATVNTPATMLGLVFICLAITWKERRLRYLGPMFIAAALFLAESALRRGFPLRTGYEDNRGFATILPYSGLPGFSFPFLFGILAIMLSFGKGLLFFAPGLLFPPTIESVDRPTRTTWLLWIAYLSGLILVYARWWSWYGGWFWGPRFFLAASVPASFALAVRLGRSNEVGLLTNLLTLAGLALSFWVGFNGLVFGQTGLEICHENNYALEHLAWYTPEFSALWRPFVARPALSDDRLLQAGLAGCFLLYLVCFLVMAAPLLASGWSQTRQLLGWFVKESFAGKKWEI
jgi:hypothetical protein